VKITLTRTEKYLLTYTAVLAGVHTRDNTEHSRAAYWFSVHYYST